MERRSLQSQLSTLYKINHNLVKISVLQNLLVSPRMMGNNDLNKFSMSYQLTDLFLLSMDYQSLEHPPIRNATFPTSRFPEGSESPSTWYFSPPQQVLDSPVHTFKTPCVPSWNDIINIDHRNHLQTSKGHMTWELLMIVWPSMLPMQQCLLSLTICYLCSPYGYCIHYMLPVQPLWILYPLYVTCAAPKDTVSIICYLCSPYGYCIHYMLPVQPLWIMYPLYVTCATPMDTVFIICYLCSPYGYCIHYMLPVQPLRILYPLYVTCATPKDTVSIICICAAPKDTVSIICYLCSTYGYCIHYMLPVPHLRILYPLYFTCEVPSNIQNMLSVQPLGTGTVWLSIAISMLPI